MSAIPYPLDPMGSTNRGSYFELVVKPGILGDSLTYGFTPYWNTGGYCKVVDWGDGSGDDATKSSSTLTHTYAEAGTYTISIKAECYRCMFGDNSTYAALVYDANGNWDALGDITAGTAMFHQCINAVFAFKNLPRNLRSGWWMFRSCTNALLKIETLPDSLVDMTHMFAFCSKSPLKINKIPSGITGNKLTAAFNGCKEAQLVISELPAAITNGESIFRSCEKSEFLITSLPDTLTNGDGMFQTCRKAVINLDALVSNAPENGWESLTVIQYMFQNAGSGNDPGTVTGSRSAFLAKCPNVKNTASAFTGTNTTN